MEVTPVTKPLIELVKKAETGEIVLPEFQRDFVWTRDNIKNYLASILSGFLPVVSSSFKWIKIICPSQLKELLESKNDQRSSSQIL